MTSRISTIATYTCAVPATADETLADEARRRKQAGALAIAAGILTLASGAVAVIVSRDQPTVPLLDSLREHLQANPPAIGLKVREALFFDEHAASVVLASVLLALTAAAIGLTLTHLYRSAKARRPELSRALVIAAVAGSTCVAVGELMHGITLVVESHKLAGSAHPTAAAARDALQPPLGLAGLLVGLLGKFALGFAVIMLALNAMRVGLLSRFMGVLGMIVGALIIVPLGASLPIVQAFWFGALGALFLGYWPSGLPPAWVTGEAQPWPTQQELREQRLARQAQSAPRASGGRQRPEPPETPAPEAPVQRAHPSSKKRRRGRR
jgi:hypothetical protein